jgi:hypothetical protein
MVEIKAVDRHLLPLTLTIVTLLGLMVRI